MKKLKDWSKLEWSGAAAVILLFFGLPFLNWITGREPAPAAPPEPPPVVVQDDFEPRRMTLEGTLVCLPHAPGYPPTKECVMGLRTDDGTHYKMDFQAMSSIPEEHRVGDRVTGSGVMTPIERLSTDYWRKYDVQGIFTVTDGFQVVR